MSFRRDLVWEQLDLEYRASVAHQFARYALAVRLDDMPQAAVHQAKRCVLDALGCAIGGLGSPAHEAAEQVAREIGGFSEATVFGSGLRTSAMNVALVNSILVRFLDFNDLGGGGHNSDALASLLAIAEREHASGAEFLLALVISYELGARFGASVTSTHGGVPIQSSLEDKGWTKDIRGGLSQPPALGRLLRMTEDEIANAIGICMSHTIPLGILDAHREEHVMAKNLRFGWVAHDAILACLLARRGFTGPVKIVESDVGIRNVVARGEMDLARLTDFGGWRILDVRFKSLAANATTHAHVLATIAIVREHILKPSDVAAVNITAPVRESRHTTAPAKKYPRNAESADHSAYFANAIAIRDRAFGPDAIASSNFSDPVILDLIDRTTVSADPSFSYYSGASDVVTKDGRVFQHRVELPHGFGSDPLRDDELVQKFRGLASTRLPDDHVQKIIDACWSLDQLPSIDALVDLMVIP